MTRSPIELTAKNKNIRMMLIAFLPGSQIVHLNSILVHLQDLEEAGKNVKQLEIGANEIFAALCS